MSNQPLVPTGKAPTRKMVDEAVNWTGPWLDQQAPGQLRQYVSILRRFAMATAMHPDYLASVIGSETGRGEAEQ